MRIPDAPFLPGTAVTARHARRNRRPRQPGTPQRHRPPLARYLREFLSDPARRRNPRNHLVADPQRHHPQHPPKNRQPVRHVWTLEEVRRSRCILSARPNCWPACSANAGPSGQVGLGHALRFAVGHPRGRPTASRGPPHPGRADVPAIRRQHHGDRRGRGNQLAVATRNQPEMRFRPQPTTTTGYLAALEPTAKPPLAGNGFAPATRPPCCISFHGLPKRSLGSRRSYFCECHKTGACWPSAWACPSKRSVSSPASARPSGSSPTPRRPCNGRVPCWRVDVICPGLSPTAWKPWKNCPKAATISRLGGREYLPPHPGAERGRCLIAMPGRPGRAASGRMATKRPPLPHGTGNQRPRSVQIRRPDLNIQRQSPYIRKLILEPVMT